MNLKNKNRIANGVKHLLVVMLSTLLMTQSWAVEKITYYHNDALGSPVAATDKDGKLLWQEAYKPYGDRIRKEDANTNDLWYTGKPHEESFGLSYFGARWYDPKVGRFMAIDPVGFKEGNIQSFNRYAYANNNPYRYVDPDGRASTDALIEQLRQNGGHLPSTNRLGGAANTLGNDIMPAAGDMLGDPVNLIPGSAIAGGIIKGSKLLSKVAKGAGKEIGILRDAAKGKGNFGLGSGSRAEADKLGRAWVGDGARVASDGKTLVSKDGLKVFRPPSAKPNSPHATTGVQANFERKIEVGGRPISNGHLDIVD